MNNTTERLDRALVERGLAESRERARAYILGGDVAVNGERMRKPGVRVREGDDVRILVKRGGYVSRGGLKLEGALEAFAVDPSGRYCLDIGASTGGFTDCLLKQGARGVTALDVGTNQLAWSLRSDDRVRVVEKFNARAIDTLELSAAPDIVTIDVSFISVLRILEPLRSVVLPGTTTIICLIKPQFELDRAYSGFRGVVKDPALHSRILESVYLGVMGQGYRLEAACPSPLKGPKGNVEFFFLLQAGGSREPDTVSGAWKHEDFERLVRQTGRRTDGPTATEKSGEDHRSSDEGRET